MSITLSRAAKIMSMAGCEKGGKVAAANMTKKQRTDRARKAARARWAKAKGKDAA